MKGKVSGTFSSPGYPKSYPENVLYQWLFPDYQHDIVLIKFLEMNLYLCYVVDKLETCQGYDQVVVEGYTTFCNWRIPTKAIILDKETIISFRTFNGTMTACRGKGFKASFEVVSKAIYLQTTTQPVTIPTTVGM